MSRSIAGGLQNMAKILIVDDYAPFRRLLNWTLSEAGHSVVDAADGFQALALARGEAIDLVISDLNMPNLDGIGLLRLLRAMPDYQRLPLLLLTSIDVEEQKQHALALGATAWMVKPFSPEELLQTIEDALPSARSELRLSGLLDAASSVSQG